MSRLGMPVGGLGAGRRNRCLGSLVTAYADRVMDVESLREWDRHLVTCMCCRAAVESERRVLASLRSPSASTLPGDLRGLLLSLASEAPGDAPAPDARRGAGAYSVPAVPVATVRVLDRGAPALHRSARRATMFAGLAAGATAAAAWSLALTGGATIAPAAPSLSPGAVLRARTPAPGFVPAVFTVPNLAIRHASAPSPEFPPSSAASSPLSSPGGARPGLGTAYPRSAQSTP